MSKALTKAQFLKVAKPRMEKVSLGADVGHVYVKEMTGTERLDFQLFLEANKGRTDMNPLDVLLVFCLCNSKGELMFKPDEAPQMAALTGRFTDRIFEAAEALNQVTRKSVEQEVKK